MKSFDKNHDEVSQYDRQDQILQLQKLSGCYALHLSTTVKSSFLPTVQMLFFKIFFEVHWIKCGNFDVKLKGTIERAIFQISCFHFFFLNILRVSWDNLVKG